MDASPTTLWVYKELTQEVKQVKHLQAAALASSSNTSEQSQLTLLQAEAYQRLAQQPQSLDRSDHEAAAWPSVAPAVAHAQKRVGVTFSLASASTLACCSEQAMSCTLGNA